MAAFFQKVGHENASRIRHVSIRFDHFLQENGLSSLESIKNYCVNLKKATMELNTIDLVYSSYEKRVTEMLVLVNTRLRAIPSLQEIIGDAKQTLLVDGLRRDLESVGRTIHEPEDPTTGVDDDVKDEWDTNPDDYLCLEEEEDDYHDYDFLVDQYLGSL